MDTSPFTIYPTFELYISTSFYHLPQEIRNCIYELCLLCEGVINPVPATWERDTAQPVISEHDKTAISTGVALLATSKQVRQESGTFFFGKNTWIFNAQSHHKTINDEEFPEFFLTHSEFMWVRRLFLSFHCQDVSPQDYLALVRQAYLSLNPTESQKYRHSTTHSAVEDALMAVWMNKKELLEFMRDLQVLEVDVEYCFCPGGCCRLLKRVCLNILAPWIFGNNVFPQGSVLCEDETWEDIEREVQTRVILKGCFYPEECDFAHRLGLWCDRCQESAEGGRSCSWRTNNAPPQKPWQFMNS